MNTKNFKRKLISALLVMVLALQIIPTTAFAVGTSPDITAVDAKNVALALVSDTIKLTTDTDWNKNTNIQKIITLYDEENNVSGYSVELLKNGKDNGYIIISAYDDVDLITEYSDKAEPLYENLNYESGDKILYTDTLTYYKQDKKNNVKDLHNKNVNKKSIKNGFKNSGNKKNKENNKKLLKEIKSKKSFASKVEGKNLISPNSAFESDGTISNPFDWATSTLGGGFTAYEWNNPFEDFCPFILMTRFNGLPGSARGGGHCAATALTNIMTMQRNMGLLPQVPSNVNTLFENVGDRWNTVTSNSYNNTIAQNWIINSYAAYGRTAWVAFATFNGGGTENNNIYSHIKYRIDQNHPLWIDIQPASNTTYNRDDSAHAVVGYAYTRLISNDSGYFTSFIKVMDGWNSSGRYLSMGSFRGTIQEINLR